MPIARPYRSPLACLPLSFAGRVLKPQNYVAVSPSRQQVARQAAMESIPLVFEPHSRLYTSPVVVLDFQVGDESSGGVVWGAGAGVALPESVE